MVGLVIAPRTPSSELVEIVERKEQIVVSELGASHSVPEQVLPEHRLSLESNALLGVELQIPGKSLEIVAVGLEGASEAGDIDPELQNWRIFELSMYSMGFELRRQSSLEIGG